MDVGRVPFASGEVACLKTALSFVDSIWELFGGLLQGIPTWAVSPAPATLTRPPTVVSWQHIVSVAGLQENAAPVGRVQERVEMKYLQRGWGRIGAVISIVLSFCAASAGCATRQSSEAYPHVYTGYVRFAGEFMLYPDAKSFASGQTLRCVSGALPLEKQKEAASQLSGKRVLVRAKSVAWAPPGESYSVNHEGSQITNWCGGRKVLLALEMKVDDRPDAVAALKSTRKTRMQ